MSSSLLQALMSERIETRLDAISHLSEVDPSERLSLFEPILTDFSCEVRRAAADSVYLCPTIYPKFLADPVPFVRIAVIQNSLRLREALNSPITILNDLANLTKDPVPAVRCALAQILPAHAKFDSDCDSRALTLEKIAPIILEMLSDHSDDVKVSTSLILIELSIIFGYDLVFEELFDQLQIVFTDRQWRVRHTGVQLIIGLGLISPAVYFNENLMMFLRRFLTEDCHKLREAAVAALPSLAKHFGEEWVMQSLIIELRQLEKSSNFLHRETYLWALSVLIPFFPVEYQANYVFHPMIRMLKDSVQNVVLLTIELLWQHHELIHPFRRQYEMRPILESLVESSSPTVTEKAAAFLLECQ
jgi:hypothetical protein